MPLDEKEMADVLLNKLGRVASSVVGRGSAAAALLTKLGFPQEGPEPSPEERTTELLESMFGGAGIARKQALKEWDEAIEGTIARGLFELQEKYAAELGMLKLPKGTAEARTKQMFYNAKEGRKWLEEVPQSAIDPAEHIFPFAETSEIHGVHYKSAKQIKANILNPSPEGGVAGTLSHETDHLLTTRPRKARMVDKDITESMATKRLNKEYSRQKSIARKEGLGGYDMQPGGPFYKRYDPEEAIARTVQRRMTGKSASKFEEVYRESMRDFIVIEDVIDKKRLHDWENLLEILRKRRGGKGVKTPQTGYVPRMSGKVGTSVIP